MREPLVNVRCDLCGSNEWWEVMRKPGRVTCYTFRIVRCEHCRLVYVNPRLCDEQIALLYGEEYYRGNGFDPGVRYGAQDDEHMRRAIRAILRSVRDALGTLREKRILDVGCGGGSLVHALRESGSAAYGIDSAPEAARICAERSVPLIANDLCSPDIAESSFDAVTAIEVIEHVPSPTAFLQRIHALLKPGGIAFIGTGNWELVRRVRGTPYVMPEGHLYYFTPKTLRAYFRKTGFGEAAALHRLWFVARAASRVHADPLTGPFVRLAAACTRFLAPQFGAFPIGRRLQQ